MAYPHLNPETLPQPDPVLAATGDQIRSTFALPQEGQEGAFDGDPDARRTSKTYSQFVQRNSNKGIAFSVVWLVLRPEYFTVLVI